jgi:o-succinylbenzoate synthase
MSSKMREGEMVLRRIDARQHRLALSAALATGAGRFETRDIVIVRAEIEIDGRLVTGWGEAAPLAGWTRGTIDDVIQSLNTILFPVVFNGFSCIHPKLRELNVLPSLRAAIELALLDALARSQAISIAALIGRSRGVRAQAAVPVQRTLGSLPLEETIAALDQAVAEGYRAAKLKVGVASLAEDRARIEAVARRFPELELRLDANGAWRMEQALEALATLPVALIEQPVAPDDFDRLLALRPTGGAAMGPAIGPAIGPTIAADESCSDFASARALIDGGRVDALVLKPSTVGGLLPALEIIDAAGAHGIRVIVSNLMESAVGRIAAAQLAAACPELPGPHGLATGQWFRSDLGPEPDRIEHGTLLLPTASHGLGFEPLAAAR